MKKKAKKIRERKMQFRVKFLFQIESTAEFNVSYKKNLFQGLPWVYFDTFLCSFCITFHQHSVWPFIFTKYILLRTNECMIQNYRWLLCITNRKNRESHEVVLNIRFLEVSYFAGIKFREFWEFDQNMRNIVPKK